MSSKSKSPAKRSGKTGAERIAECRKRMASYSDERRQALNDIFRALVKGVHA